MSARVTMPALGESVTEGTVTRWLKNVGDTVAVDEPLLEVSTDKVDTEIPSPVAGTLQEILVAEDETADEGIDSGQDGAEDGEADLAVAAVEPVLPAVDDGERRRHPSGCVFQDQPASVCVFLAIRRPVDRACGYFTEDPGALQRCREGKFQPLPFLIPDDADPEFDEGVMRISYRTNREEACAVGEAGGVDRPDGRGGNFDDGALHQSGWRWIARCA